MRSIYMALASLALTGNCLAQSHLKYSDEGFDTKKVELKYAPKTPGQQFCQRMDVLYNQSKTTYLTQTQYNQYLSDFQNAANGEPNQALAGKLQFMSLIMNDVNKHTYNNEGSRNTIYNYTYPVYKAVTQSWGDEVVSTAIANAYFQVREYVTEHAVDNHSLKEIAANLDNNATAMSKSNVGCDYTVTVDPKVTKDKIEVYFSDFGMYYKAATKYPADKLLVGPVPMWNANKEESESIRGMMKAYTEIPNQMGHYVYSASLDNTGKVTNLNQTLNSDMKWFVWVFRNNQLYYSYMIEPCSRENRCSIQ